ncbi:MAG: transglycosylase domain-containing protein, partial [Spirochaetaceae bacterium]
MEPREPCTLLFLKRLIPFVFALLLTAVLLYLPDQSLQRMRGGLEGVVLADRRGEPLYSVPTRDGGYQHRLSWTRIPEPVRETFVRLEDRRFYSHAGVDLAAAARAAVLNLQARRVVSGASTITMQLARMIHPHGGGLPGKAAEVLRALHLEARLSKRQILLLYLNNLPFGYNTLGVGAAARAYFSRSLEELSMAQILLLAVIPKAPSLYDPFGASVNRAALKERAVSLAPLLSVSAEEIDQAMSTFRRGQAELHAPHFIRYVLARARELEQGAFEGFEIVGITTTLDFSLYDMVNQSVRDGLAAAGGLSEGRNSGTSSGGTVTDANRPRNASALVLDNRSGQVLVWVGSQDFFDKENSGEIDGVRLKSSSGSTLKPFLYAAALERGYNASTLLPDLALTFGAEEGYRPENFDRRSRGLVRLRTALASSLNVPAVYLLSRIGLGDFLSTCRDLGIELPEDAEGRVGLGAAIGNLEVSLLELTRAFSVFPNRGFLPEIRVIQEVETADGRRIPLEGRDTGAPWKGVFREQTAWLISDMLADPAARATGFGLSSRFNTAFPALFKSGTASEYTSLWCVGALPGYTVGVWAGNFDGRPAFGTTGSSLPAAVAVEVLERLSAESGASRDSPATGPPPGISTVRICTQTGQRASAGCPATREEYFLSGASPAEECRVHDRGESMEELLYQVVLGEERQPRVLFPRNGMVFYRESGAAVNSQTIPGWVVADPQ